MSLPDGFIFGIHKKIMQASIFRVDSIHLICQLFGMETITSIFDRFGGTTATAAVLGVKLSTASEMKRRESIPVKYWPILIAEAKYRRIKLTNDMLVAVHLNPSQANSEKAKQ